LLRSRYIRPLPPSVDITNLREAVVPAEFSADDFDWNGGYLTMTVFEEDLYDAVEVNKMRKGDKLIWGGDTIVVQEIAHRGDAIVVNGSIEEGGAELVPHEGGTYRARTWDDHSNYTELGKAQVLIAVDFAFIDCRENPTDPYDTICRKQIAYIDSLKDNKRDFINLNTTVQIEHSIITGITRRWIP